MLKLAQLHQSYRNHLIVQHSMSVLAEEAGSSAVVLALGTKFLILFPERVFWKDQSTIEVHVSIVEVSNGAKIRNRYNQVPLLILIYPFLLWIHANPLSQTGSTLARTNLSLGGHWDWAAIHPPFLLKYIMRSLLAWLRALHPENID